MSDLLTFKAISNFISDLSGAYEEQYRDVKLYKYLIDKTTLTHETAIQKHITAFSNFCKNNREGILQKDFNILLDDDIVYSEKVKVPLKEILKNEEDEETKVIIWDHILTISSIVDPDAKAIKLLLAGKIEKEKSAGNGNENELDFISNAMDTVQNSINPEDLGDNPMSNISSILSSGVFTNLISDLSSNIENGNLDMGKLLTSVQGMMGQNNDAGFDLSSMLGGLTDIVENSGGEVNEDLPEKTNLPDPKMIMGMMDMFMNNKK